MSAIEIPGLDVQERSPGTCLRVLSEGDAAGRSWFITEGLLRLLHRAEAPAPASYRTTGPYRTFRREDAMHTVPGVPETVRFALLPVSWTLQPGNHLRLAIADDYSCQPAAREVDLTAAGLRGWRALMYRFAASIVPCLLVARSLPKQPAQRPVLNSLFQKSRFAECWLSSFFRSYG